MYVVIRISSKISVILFSVCPVFHQGIRARILETFVMLFLLALLILGIVWVASALIDNDAASMESLYGMFLKYSSSLVIVNIWFSLFKLILLQLANTPHFG